MDQEELYRRYLPLGDHTTIVVVPTEILYVMPEEKIRMGIQCKHVQG